MHPVMLLPAGADTQALRKALWHYRIGHRITDEADGQLLWVADPRNMKSYVPWLAAGSEANR